jgi:hypothetical protein
LHALFSLYYPNYNAQKADVLALVEKIPEHIPADVPIFIGNLKNDTLTSDETVTRLVTKLRQTLKKNPLYYFVSDDTKLKHASLSKSLAYQQAVNAFLKKYNLPHDPQLAQQGEGLLEQARKRAEELGE